MVEGEVRELVEGVPLGGGGIIGGDWAYACRVSIGGEDAGETVEARVAFGSAVEAKGSEGKVSEIGFLGKFTCGCVGGVFVLVDEATREGPLLGKGFVLALDEKDLGGCAGVIEDDDVKGCVGARVIVGVGHLWERFFLVGYLVASWSVVDSGGG